MSKHKTKEQVVALLEAAAAKAGDGQPLGIGTLFWGDMQGRMSGDPDIIRETDKMRLQTGLIGTWRGRQLFIIPGNLTKPGLDKPRPWKG